MGLFAQGLFADGLFASNLFAGDELSIEILTTTLPTGLFQEFYQTFIQVSGATPIAYSIIAGALPAGLTLNPSIGVISGVLLAEGTFHFTVEATNAFGTDEQAYVFTSVGFVEGRAIFQLQKTSLPYVEVN